MSWNIRHTCSWQVNTMQLVALLGEFAEHGASGARAAGVEVDEHVVEDHRQVDAAAGVRATRVPAAG